MITKMLHATVMMARAHHSSCSLTGVPSGVGLPVVIGLPLQNNQSSAMPPSLSCSASAGLRILDQQMEDNGDLRCRAAFRLHKMNVRT